MDSKWYKVFLWNVSTTSLCFFFFLQSRVKVNKEGTSASWLYLSKFVSKLTHLKKTNDTLYRDIHKINSTKLLP